MSDNRLDRETSPYLLQHKDNPVHWRAWSPDALSEAKETGKPILLSVGYSACHWCHVMAHESFEDEATAAIINDLYVAIKVDREERPDIDAIYIAALQRLGEQAGWPLTMFLDPDAKPFWGGTYFPPEARWGRPGFKDVLRDVARIYREQPDKVAHNARVVLESLGKIDPVSDRLGIDDDMLAELTRQMTGLVDPLDGGIEGTPKFPQWSFFWLLWRGGIRYRNEEAKHAVVNTLLHICQGGIYDHLGGGFARYSTDRRWLVPHFEKMLYDNALLIDLLTEVWRETHDPLFRRRVEETVGWLASEMTVEGGGFASSLDADSEGEEGKYYLWSLAEVLDVLGPEDGRRFAAVYDISSDGNFERRNIPNRLSSLALLGEAYETRLSAMREKLLGRRRQRVRPGWDDKILADWNGLTIAALARASIVFERPDWLAMAQRAFAFVTSHLCEDGRLWHSYRAGELRGRATASDYAALIWAALRLFEATGQSDRLDQARVFTRILDDHYWVDDAGGAYAQIADDTGDVIVRLRTGQDDAVPSANAMMLHNLIQLYLLTHDTSYRQRADSLAQSFGGALSRSTLAHCGLLAGCMDLMAPLEVAVTAAKPGSDTTLLRALRSMSLPGALVRTLANASELPPDSPLAGKTAVQGKPTAYVCVDQTCSQPVSDAAELKALLLQRRSI